MSHECLACVWERALGLPRGTYADHNCDRPEGGSA